MSNDLPHEEPLFAGFDSLIPPWEASLHAVEQTRRLLLEPPAHPDAPPAEYAGKSPGSTSPVPQTVLSSLHVKPRSRIRPFARYGLAAALLLVAVLGAHFIVTRNSNHSTVATNESSRQQPSQEQNSVGEPIVPGAASPVDREDIPPFAAAIISDVHVVSAERAPVIVANGGKEPIRLGSSTDEAGSLLHVWDWSKSPISRVLPDVEFRGLMTVSPDGNQLVWGDGAILDLRTGHRSRIDLGDLDLNPETGAYRQIGGMQFSPDGGRVALSVTHLERRPSKSEPPEIKAEMVEVVEFPSGRRICEFPAGVRYGFGIGFSPDGRHIASTDPAKQVMLRGAATGEIHQRFAPALASQLMGVAISPDSQYVAAVQLQPCVLFIWESDTGRLMHRIEGGNQPYWGMIRFSPDGKHLAAALEHLVVCDVQTGETTPLGPSAYCPTNIQWSDDGRRVTVVTPVMTSDWTQGSRENRYPSVDVWDWRNQRRIPLFEEEAR